MEIAPRKTAHLPSSSFFCALFISNSFSSNHPANCSLSGKEPSAASPSSSNAFRCFCFRRSMVASLFDRSLANISILVLAGIKKIAVAKQGHSKLTASAIWFGWTTKMGERHLTDKSEYHKNVTSPTNVNTTKTSLDRQTWITQKRHLTDKSELRKNVTWPTKVNTTKTSLDRQTWITQKRHLTDKSELRKNVTWPTNVNYAKTSLDRQKWITQKRHLTDKSELNKNTTDNWLFWKISFVVGELPFLIPQIWSVKWRRPTKMWSIQCWDRPEILFESDFMTEEVLREIDCLFP